MKGDEALGAPRTTGLAPRLAETSAPRELCVRDTPFPPIASLGRFTLPLTTRMYDAVMLVISPVPDDRPSR